MAATRESVFLCTYASPSRRIIVRVLAWDTREALETFKEDLEHEGALGRGRICVTGPGSGASARAVTRGRAFVTSS